MSTHKWVNVMYLSLTHSNPVTVNDLETILNGMADSWGTSVTPQCTNNVTLVTVNATWVGSAGTSLQYTHSEVKTGANANPILDAASCAVINWHIGDFYRGGHPRSYMPGPAGNQIVNASDFTAAYQTALAAAWTSFLNTVNGLTSTNVTAVALGTVRYQSGNNWLSPPVFRPFQSCSVRPKLGTQRRRLTE